MMYTWTDGTDYLMHHGIKGQKWGVRRFQNPDGTLTEAGKKRYLKRLGWDELVYDDPKLLNAYVKLKDLKQIRSITSHIPIVNNFLKKYVGQKIDDVIKNELWPLKNNAMSVEEKQKIRVELAGDAKSLLKNALMASKATTIEDWQKLSKEVNDDYVKLFNMVNDEEVDIYNGKVHDKYLQEPYDKYDRYMHEYYKNTKNSDYLEYANEMKDEIIYRVAIRLGLPGNNDEVISMLEGMLFWD